MFLKEIKEINNYRNLTGKNIVFNKSLNYIIGENNTGKTNVLELINAIFAVGKFVDTDFYNVKKAIEIKFSIGYDESSIGFFEDNFDVDDSNVITIIALQEIVDGRLSYYHDTPNKTEISYSLIRKINTLYYYAQRMPSKELDFKKTSGTGKVLNYLIQKSLQKSGFKEEDVIDRNNMKSVIAEINHSIAGINTITGDRIQAYLDPVMDKIVSRLLMLGDENGRDLASLGVGIQYAFNIILQIIDSIYNTKVSRKSEDFEERLIVVDGKKFFPLLLLLDEPEIHQHPYRQRNLMKKIDGLFNNENEDFTRLLQDFFNVDGLIGQIFIATHSPNILLDDYKQFIRIYKDANTKILNIVSGETITLDGKLYKHLLHNYIYLKEAMFSKAIVFVEGDTENGAIPVFAARNNFDLDEHGIGIIKLDGADSVLRCMDLYNKFEMKTYAIIDQDKKDNYESHPNIFFTTGKDYEEDIYTAFRLKDYLKCCKELEILCSMINPIKGVILELNVKDFLDNPENIPISSEEVCEGIMNQSKEKQLEKLRGLKNASTGAILARYVTEIPSAFNELFKTIAKGIQ